MPNTDKNKSGGHSHPQKDNRNNNDQGDTPRTTDASGGEVLGTGEKAKSHQGPKESFGSTGYERQSLRYQ